jgi:hypothetical protein
MSFHRKMHASQNATQWECAVLILSLASRTIWGTMRPKARGLAQHGGPPGWLDESDPAGVIFVCDGRAISPAFSVPYRLP